MSAVVAAFSAPVKSSSWARAPRKKLIHEIPPAIAAERAASSRSLQSPGVRSKLLSVILVVHRFILASGSRRAQNRVVSVNRSNEIEIGWRQPSVQGMIGVTGARERL